METKRQLTTERRQFKRVKTSTSSMFRVIAPLLVRMQIEDKEVESILHDISEGGTAILTNYEIPVDSLLSVNFTLFNDTSIRKESKRIEAEGETRYNLITENKEYRIGVKFTNISPKDRNFISRYTR